MLRRTAIGPRSTLLGEKAKSKHEPILIPGLKRRRGGGGGAGSEVGGIIFHRDQIQISSVLTNEHDQKREDARSPVPEGGKKKK